MSRTSEMHSTLRGIGHALADSTLVVPKDQRHYAWTKKHVKDLCQDVAAAIDKNETEYFLGSIVVIGDPSDKLEVVDGQQRLATLTILFATLRDYFSGQHDPRADDVEHNYLLTRDILTQELVPRL
jgi:uncharacterized protein with ParB-like and HNH nuclease domain